MAKRSENEVRREYKYNEAEDLAVQRYGPKAQAKELSGLTTKANLDRWSERAASNSALAAKSKTKGTKGV